MSLIDFIDKHWSFWFASFLLALAYFATIAFAALVAALIELFGRRK